MIINVFANNFRNLETDSVSIAIISASAAFAESAAVLRPFFATPAPSAAAAAPATPLLRFSCIATLSFDIPILAALLRT